MTDDYPGIERKWISKEEAKEFLPDKPITENKFEWRYICYICGMKKLGSGEPIKQCDCKHFKPKVLINVGK